MQLKSIEIVGFKSFAEKTRIDFPNGMTGIVGPNGSGKSNIAESIRWVLGEQSAKSLRGSKMPDVIFSGSSNRKSQGMAAVSLILDNSDHYINSAFSELKITRKLFRDGDSTYMINEKECRLKDIVDLFMDTGIGQGSLSIISQGNVEAIFNSKPEERRSIIENVAGVYKYKQQKDTANKELAKTNDNLDRVEDIIQELQGRLQPLEEQSSIAKDYLDQKKQLDGLEKSSLIVETNQLRVDKSKTRSELDEKSALVSKMTKSVSELTNHRNEQKTEESNLQKKIDQQQDDLLTLSQQIESLKSQQQLSSQQLAYKQTELQRHVDQLKQLEINLEDNDEKKQKINNHLKQLTDEQHKLQEQLTTIDHDMSRYDSVKIESQIQAAREKYVDLLQEQTRLKNEISLREHDNQQLDERLKEKKSQISKLEAELESKTAELATGSNQLSELKIKANQIQSDLTDAQQTQARLTQAVNDANSSWLAALKIAEEAKAKKNSLASLHSTYQGFYYGVANLLRNKDKFSGIYGPVSDFLEIDKQYVKAIDTALSGQSQNVIVANNQTASESIRYLTTNRLGRVTLLPVDTIKPRRISSALLSNAQGVDGFVGVAADLVEMPEQFTNIRYFLLGTTFVASELKAAIAISKVIGHRNRVVTLDGQIVNPGGSLTGGANKKSSQSVLIQQSELESLNANYDEMQKKLKLRENELTLLKDKLEKAGQLTAEIMSKKNQFAQQWQIVKSECDRKQTELDQRSRQIETLKLALNNEIKDNGGVDEDAINLQLTKIADQIKSIESESQQLQKDLSVAREKQSGLTEQKQKLNEQQAVNRQQIKQLQSELNELKMTNETISREKDEINTKHKQLQNELSSTKSAAAIESQIKEQQTTFNTLHDTLGTNRQELQRLARDNDELSEQISTDQINLNSATSEKADAQKRLSAIDNHIQSNLLELSENYGLTASEISVGDGSDDLDEIRRRIRMLQRGIDEIGPVNIGAIAEFEEVSHRFEFLNGQKDDLVSAKNKLIRTMNQMERTISTKFKETFDEVAKTFSKVFVDMFGGGEAKLVLVDPDDLLNTGIEIMVKPPGKNYRNLSLLSGGEKALTAITLLFSIIKVRPVPFCILDEAEAALDPFNADRFANYLKQFGNGTQFIVITHRKETMIYADQLYGITMQESGVSKVVTVNLDNLKQEVN
ncbi:chromosome segregation protein SMC [Lentilactobacillus sp. Marseille-Q4993]|uniref:chromosome segregation protein SMC n=1 Tax=Lentilactobacillus sp. Marseille-Q4993 TaxID=3039492 RepID=UPI0024BCD930|nr:chromosome segregation protein SMC [Lentilactobacillus sp. Marseille-Q4993]